MTPKVPLLTKKYLLPLFAFLVCIAAYLFTKTILLKQIYQTNVFYVSHTSSEVYMVWGTIDAKLPEKPNWPDSTYEKDDMLWSKMKKNGADFNTTLHLSQGTIFYYWMVQTKDTSNKKTEIWDSGGNKNYFTGSVKRNPFLNPGLFILLAGLIPLLLIYKNQQDNRKIFLMSSK